MGEPSSKVPPVLLPHVHLVSSYRFPILPHLSVDHIVDNLVQAPRIVQREAPMIWMFLDAPADGTVFLVWQPSQLGSIFASDGYMWADPEQAFTLNVKGLSVEMFVHRSGLVPGQENVATHARRRYRLNASADPNIQIDPSLWLVHYATCDPNHRLPANQIRMNPQIQQSMNMRRFLQSQGQLVRKEFMLHDPQNWPTINVPGGGLPASQPPPGAMYPGNPLAQGARSMPGNPFYSGQHPQSGMGPSPAKRQRGPGPSHQPTNSSIAAQVAAAAMLDPTIDDEEDTSRGDLLDHLTPREISMLRYKQHHEWMEEILSSPYGIDQIVPVDLGLGLKGELEGLTKGYLEPPPTDDAPRPAGSPNPVGKMEPGKAEEFQKRALDWIDDIKKDMEKMKKAQAKRMEKLKKGSLVKDAERRLRDAVDDPTNITEVRRASSGADNDGNDKPAAIAQGPREKVDDIVSEVESYIGKHIEKKQSIVQVEKGGYEEIVVEEAIEEPPAPDDVADGMLMEGEGEQPEQRPEQSGQSLESHEAETTPNLDAGEDTDMQMEGDISMPATGTPLDTATLGNGALNFDFNDTPASTNGNLVDGMVDGDIDMHNSAGGLLDQYYTSNPSTPGVSLSTPQAQLTAATTQGEPSHDTPTNIAETASNQTPAGNAEPNQALPSDSAPAGPSPPQGQ